MNTKSKAPIPPQYQRSSSVPPKPPPLPPTNSFASVTFRNIPPNVLPVRLKSAILPTQSPPIEPSRLLSITSTKRPETTKSPPAIPPISKEKAIIEPPKTDSPEHLDLDYVFINEIGQFGKYQLFMMLIIAVSIIWTAFGLDYIFTAASIDHRCFVPECDSSESPDYAPSWLLNAIPGNSLTNFDNCFRYDNSTEVTQDPGVCPATLFDRNQTVRCESYVYERTNSIVYDFGLECREWQRALVGTANGVGTMIAMPITGLISDKFGRKLALVINLFNFGLFGFIRTFSVNYNMFVSLRLLQLSLGDGAFSAAFLLATEFVGPRYRVVVGVMISTLFACGQTVLGLYAWALPQWRTLNIVLYTQIMFGVGFYFIIFESPRWLLSKNKFKEAKEILEKLTKINNKKISESTYRALLSVTNTKKEPSLLGKIFRSKIMLRRICTTSFWWITNVLIYYGLSINSVGLDGNMYINFIYVSIAEIPGYWTAFVFLQCVGRKITLMVSYLTCAVCVISFAFIPEGHELVSMIFYLISKFAIAAVFSSMYIYTAELYPTKHRHSLLGFSSMVGRIGAIIAPLTPAMAVYWHGITPLIFGLLAFISAMLVLTSPETIGTKLPETMEEAENIGRNIEKVIYN